MDSEEEQEFFGGRPRFFALLEMISPVVNVGIPVVGSPASSMVAMLNIAWNYRMLTHARTKRTSSQPFLIKLLEKGLILILNV